MAHELEIRDGQACMMYAGETPWHKLGTKVEKEVTSAACIRLAGLDWRVEKQPLYIAGKNAVDGIPVIGSVAPDRYGVVRMDDQKVLGVVGSAYEVIQNEEAFAFLDSLVGEGLAMYHTAGSLFGGRKLFITCKLPESMNIGPDQIDKYLVLATAHDGSMMMHVKWTPIRVVCWNTMSAAFRIGANGKVDKTTDMVSILHRGKIQEQVKAARDVLGLTRAYYDRVEECFNKLRQCKIRECDFTRFVNRLVPDGERADGQKIDRSKHRDAIRAMYHGGLGNDHPDVAGTKWAAYSAVTEYVDHGRAYHKSDSGEAAEVRMNAIVWGQGARMKREALEMLMAE